MKVGNKEVIDILIDETPVVKVYRGEDVIWEREPEPKPLEIIYGWDKSMGLPSNQWYYDGAGSKSMTDDGLNMKTIYAQYHYGLFYLDSTVRDGTDRILIAKIKPITTSNQGIKVLLSNGSKGIQCTFNGGYLNVLTGSTALSTITMDAIAINDVFHELRLELNSTETSKVYLDGLLIKELLATELSTNSAARTWLDINQGEAIIEEFKIYNL